MVKPLWAIAGVALLGTAGIAGAIVVASPGGEEEVVREGETTPAASATTPAGSSTPSPEPSPEPIPAEWQTYVDPVYDYSFKYPANWFISPPGANMNGYVAVTTYNPATARAVGPVPGDQMKVEFYVDDIPNDLSINDWIAERRALGGTEVISETEDTLGGVLGVTQVVHLLSFDSRSTQSFFKRGEHVYVIHTYHSDSPQISARREIMDTFQFGP